MAQQHPGRHDAPMPDGDHEQDDSWPRHGPVPPAEQRPPQSGYRVGRGNRIQPVTAAVIAVIAALAAAVMVLILTKGPSSSPSASTGPGNAPAGGAPFHGGNGGGGALGGGGGGGGGGGHLMLGGQVTKVTSTSITIGGQGHSVTAAITSSTQFTGPVKNAGGIKVGDRVMVAISGYGSSHPVVGSISDPAQMP
jgi:hypothetical protein